MRVPDLWSYLPLGSVCRLYFRKFNLSYHFYAHDSQLYLSFQPTIPGDRDLAVSNFERCVLETDHWMLVNRLKLNNDKTELLLSSAKHLPVSVASRNLCRQSDHLLLTES